MNTLRYLNFTIRTVPPFPSTHRIKFQTVILNNRLFQLLVEILERKPAIKYEGFSATYCSQC